MQFIKKRHDSYLLDKERTIILMPYAYSQKNLEESFWTRLVLELIKKNKSYIILYTNVASSREKVIPGTAPLITTLPELVYLAEKINCFIGLRSGIFDLLVFTNARLLYVMQGSYFDLKRSYNHTNSIAFNANSGADSLIEQITNAVYLKS